MRNLGARRVEHRAILDAAKAKDADGAAPALTRLYARTAFEVIGSLDPSHGPAALRLAVDAPVAGQPASI